MQEWLVQIGAIELVQGWRIARGGRRIDACGTKGVSTARRLSKRVSGQRIRFWFVIKLEQTAARIDAGVIKFAALRRLKPQLGWATIVALFDDFKRHGARHNGQIQA